tara:strand:+ start:2959 stop:3525 length:567 start_codon:yes stop_codon:yes gene_type:complete
MSFFKMSDGTAPSTNGTAEMGGGNLPPIPSGTQLKAMIVEAKWDDGGQYNNRHIKLRWDVVDGEYKKRVVFQKVQVCETDANKRDKAIRMLAAIDANCGGKIMQLNAEPTDMDLMSNLCNKPMVIKVEVWEMEGQDGETRSGNWVSAVSSGKPQAPAQPVPQQPQQQSEPQAETNNPDVSKADNELGF